MMIMIVVRVKNVFDKLASVEDNAGGFVIEDVEEVEASVGDRVFGIVYNAYVKPFGCFVVCIDCE